MADETSSSPPSGDLPWIRRRPARRAGGGGRRRGCVRLALKNCLTTGPSTGGVVRDGLSALTNRVTIAPRPSGHLWMLEDVPTADCRRKAAWPIDLMRQRSLAPLNRTHRLPPSIEHKPGTGLPGQAANTLLTTRWMSADRGGRFERTPVMLHASVDALGRRSDQKVGGSDPSGAPEPHTATGFDSTESI